MIKKSIKVSDVLAEKGFKRVNVLQFFGFLIGVSACTLGYTVTDQYQDRMIVCFILAIIQAIICLVSLLFNHGKVLSLSLNELLLTFYIPIAFAPLACLYIDSTVKRIQPGISGVVLEKLIERRHTRVGKAESKILIIKTKNEILKEAVLWSFFDQIKIGDPIGIDMRKGLIGFRKVVEYYRI